ncbi:hypothetical protein AK812_SmicGene46053 [Symbiodinium microadriaticum]|uniref:Secreted protein n=1 Tax=Symbiodinium microadriaticum TaxID=2951 RepID=A0A1Q9BUS2_SYMMI|nr:hypothetical protein AK812_SmicGene46053 [Symbiodinium microadriaticum]
MLLLVMLALMLLLLLVVVAGVVVVVAVSSASSPSSLSVLWRFRFLLIPLAKMFAPKEWPVVDWPPELAGHPWGFRTWPLIFRPCVPLEEVEEYKQADGSICLLVHATGLEENR